MELQLYHRWNLEGDDFIPDDEWHPEESIAISVLIDIGHPNYFMGSLAEHLRNRAGDKSKFVGAEVPLNLSSILPSSQGLSYYTYSGSYTRAPCKEGLTWYVLKEPVEASKLQVTA